MLGIISGQTVRQTNEKLTWKKGKKKRKNQTKKTSKMGGGEERKRWFQREKGKMVILRKSSGTDRNQDL